MKKLVNCLFVIILLSCKPGGSELIIDEPINNKPIEVPDLAGMNIKGWVSSDGIGIPDVAVSDGYELTLTDANGIYYLESEKKNGLVFISIPGAYEPPVKDNVPQFFQYLKAGVETVEQMDFELTAVDNDRHVVLAIADSQLANRTNDLAQFAACINDLNNVISAYKADGIKPYILTLGDMTWEQFWVSRNYGLPEYINEQKKFGTAVFNVIGNHDHDPYYAGDWIAEQTYRRLMGPNWYSFNLGKVHYVVLDNIEYVNTGASVSPPVTGSSTFNYKIPDYQLEWLEKDLAAVSDKTAPLILAMHGPLYSMPNLSNASNFVTANGQALLDCLEGFTDVLVLTGHMHYNYRAGPIDSRPGLLEHNMAAICGTWWWTGNTGHAGNHICMDGSVGGYGVYEINGRDKEWYYKSIGYDRDHQFRAYDLNSIYITADKYAPYADSTYAAMAAQYAGGYDIPHSDNEVLINVWGWDPQWNVIVTENNVPLEVTRVSAKDPLHIISYEFSRLNLNAVPTSTFLSYNSTHFFKVTAGSPASTLNIKVTDRFNKVYTETMTLPRELTVKMDDPDPSEEVKDGWNNVTSLLQNTTSPFEREGSALGPNLYKAKYWTVNAAAAANGNVSVSRDSSLGMIANAANGVPTNTISNGKMYQTLELEAGIYSFDVTVYVNAYTTANQPYSYIVAVLGDDLPDTYTGSAYITPAVVAQETLACLRIPRVGTTSSPATAPRPVSSIEFTLSETSTVSLGFAASFINAPNGTVNFQTFFEKVRLWKKK